MTTTRTETHARELYAFERLVDPSLPAWDAAPWLTQARWYWEAVEDERAMVPAERAA